MKRSLYLVSMLFSAAVISAPDYQGCTVASNSEVCQAYLAGLNDGKTARTASMAEAQDGFRSRALEQRVGERYRKMAQTEQKTASVPQVF